MKTEFYLVDWPLIKLKQTDRGWLTLVKRNRYSLLNECERLASFIRSRSWKESCNLYFDLANCCMYCPILLTEPFSRPVISLIESKINLVEITYLFTLSKFDQLRYSINTNWLFFGSLAFRPHFWESWEKPGSFLIAFGKNLLAYIKHMPT